ncbi:MAG: glycine cleavage system aminomethyltransferase GcvT [Spirochaetia bacterium]
MAEDLRQTALYSWHRNHGARMGPFAGWDMPLQYETGAIAEHRAVREQAGIFDISHMGQVEVSGPDAVSFLDYTLTNDILGLPEGLSTYCLMCRPDGGVLDDVFVYRLPDRFYVVVNAGNIDKDEAWLRAVAAGEAAPVDSAGGSPGGGRSAGGFDVRITNKSWDTSMFALQGPQALEVFERAAGHGAADIERFAIREDRIAGADCLVSRTGYTGEDGVEIYMDNGAAAGVWEALRDAGSFLPDGLLPIGLAARDSLRFEPGFALYGHELDEDTTPIEARLKWACELERPFAGRDALLAQIESGVSKKLATIRMIDRAMLREGYEVRSPEGTSIGRVVTGMYSPTLEWYYGNVFVTPAYAKTGAELDIVVRGRTRRAEVVKRPLYRPAYRS